jgi:hypothetical protein
MRSVLILLIAVSASVIQAQQADNRCQLGIESNFAPWDAKSLPAFLKACKDLGAEFVVFQFRPKDGSLFAGRPDAAVMDFRDFAAACKDAELTFFANQEITNYSYKKTFIDKNGQDLLAHPDGTHRLDITGEILEARSKIPEFRGAVYDEAEHAQMRREANTNGGSDSQSTWCPVPYFAATDGMTIPQAYKDVNLVFLTGVEISKPTLEAVRAFVRGGGLCVTLATLAPADLAAQSGEVPDQQGKWLIVKDFKADTIKSAVAPYLGAPDEIRYRIGGRVLTVKKGKDGNEIRIYLQNAGDEVNGGQPPEAARVW